MQDLFEIDNGVLTAYTGQDPDVTVPEGVKEIGDGAFKGLAWLLSVKLPDSVTKIGTGAFKGCRKLRSINFPEGLSSVGEYAFHRCHDLTELIFPKTVTEVGGYAFLYCDGVKKVVLEGPKKLYRAAFSHNLSLEEISLNADLDDSNFGDEVFEGCISLRRIFLSGKLYEVNNLIGAMDSHADHPDLIRSIAKSVYHSLQIEDGVLESFNINLKVVTLPEGITTIGKSCFFDKKGIESITLPESLKTIRANAFLNCMSLEELTIQNGEISLDDRAFRGCCNLKRVNLKGKTYHLEEETDNETVSRIRDQVLGDFYISGHTLVRYLGDEEQVTIPKEVKIIGERCFFGKESLKTVTCPENLKEIREQAFAGCLTLQTVILPAGLIRIEREAFAECRKLYRCNIPESLEYIGEYAFRRCITLPSFDPWPDHADIHPYAFYKAGNFADFNKEKDRPEARVTRIDAEYDIAPYAHANDPGIERIDLRGVKRIGRYAYASCPNLKEIVIDAPECVIEAEAFARCHELKTVRIHVHSLGEGTFSYCRDLTEVTLAGISVLPAAVFAGCYSLCRFEAKELTGMEERCFDECINLDSFDFTGIKKIGDRAFERCDSLKHADLSDVECGYHAFADCSSLSDVTISEGTVLKSGVFTGCTGIKAVACDSHEYKFSKFADSLNHAGNPYPVKVREVIASIYSCFEIRERNRLVGYSQDATSVTVPEDIVEIGQDVFRDHVRLEKISIPESVKLFGSHAFSMTGWLDHERGANDLVIVNGVLIDATKAVGRVTIPASVKRIASWSFAGNINITELMIPSDRIAVEALSFRNCLNLKKITDWDDREYVLTDVSDLKYAGYPELIQRIFTESINCFKLDGGNNLIESTGNITELKFPEGIKSIGDGVYKDCHLLESIVLSGDTKSIGKSAFESSKWLKTVENAGAVERIGALAFSGCQSLESIDLSDSLCELGSRCFEHCSSLKEIHISDNLSVIPERAFFRCKSLRKLVIPESVKTIEAEAFAFCSVLEEVQVPEKTDVSENAFAFCDSIKIIKYGERSL